MILMSNNFKTHDQVECHFKGGEEVGEVFSHAKKKDSCQEGRYQWPARTEFPEIVRVQSNFFLSRDLCR